LIGLTSLRGNGKAWVAPKLNRRRAVFVLTRIDEILAWERNTNRERDTRFVDLGRYLCEVRAGQYWRIDNLKSFDEFLERKFPESRRKGYYLMAIHERLHRVGKAELQQVGWSKAVELARVARRDGQQFDCATWVRSRSTGIASILTSIPSRLTKVQEQFSQQRRARHSLPINSQFLDL